MRLVCWVVLMCDVDLVGEGARYFWFEMSVMTNGIQWWLIKIFSYADDNRSTLVSCIRSRYIAAMSESWLGQWLEVTEQIMHPRSELQCTFNWSFLVMTAVLIEFVFVKLCTRRDWEFWVSRSCIVICTGQIWMIFNTKAFISKHYLKFVLNGFWQGLFFYV